MIPELGCLHSHKYSRIWRSLARKEAFSSNVILVDSSPQLTYTTLHPSMRLYLSLDAISSRVQTRAVRRDEVESYLKKREADGVQLRKWIAGLPRAKNRG